MEFRLALFTEKDGGGMRNMKAESLSHYSQHTTNHTKKNKGSEIKEAWEQQQIFKIQSPGPLIQLLSPVGEEGAAPGDYWI